MCVALDLRRMVQMNDIKLTLRYLSLCIKEQGYCEFGHGVCRFTNLCTISRHKYVIPINPFKILKQPICNDFPNLLFVTSPNDMRTVPPKLCNE